MRCPECGAELPHAARFCPGCGAGSGAACAPAAAPVAAPADTLADRLQRLVPQEYAERLRATRGRLGHERRLVTILFCDVSGSTAMAEGLDPEEVLEVMDGAFEFLIAPVCRYEGTLAQLMGDAILAIFGAPLAHEDDPERAIRAGLEMIAGAQQYAAKLERELGIRGFAVRVGINTGQVVVGEVGSDLRTEYTALGDAVNLAARMEQSAPPGGILITHAAYRHVRGVFDVQAQPPLQVKGKSEPVQTYLVERAKPRAWRMGRRGVEGVETRMVGREVELLALQQAYREAVEGREARVVTVVGEPGVGKSRLLDEFAAWVDLAREHVWYLRGRATAEGRAVARSLWRDLFAYRYDILETDTAAVALEKFREGMAGLLEPDRADLVGHLVGFDFSASPAVARRLGSPSFGQVAAAHLVQYLAGLAALNPVVALLEDLHWADDSSLDLVTQIVEGLPAAPLLIVAAARPELLELRPSWGEGQEAYGRLELKPLSKRASRDLVREILQKVAEIPMAVQQLVVDGAEGNPFYAEELVKMLIEDGAILPGEEEWQVQLDRLAQVRVPATLTAVLQARLDALPQDEKEVLQRASVVGREFWASLVGELAADAVQAEEVKPLLSSLRERELVYRRERSAFAGTEEYLFKHAVLRDVTYDTVLLKPRRSYHARVAAWLEEHAGERLGEYLALIARHYELAHDGKKAVHYLLKAGDRARGLYALQEANDHYRRALALLKEQGEYQRAAETLLRLGLVHTAAFEPDKAREAYDEAFELWEPLRESWEPSDEHAPVRTLRLAAEEPLDLDPARISDDVSTFIAAQLFEGLVRIDTDYNVLPAVATRWKMADGGRRYTFRLREGVRWSDGSALTAHDFQHAWRRNLRLDPPAPLADLLYVIKNARAFGEGRIDDPEQVGVTALDEHTLEVCLEEPVAYLPQLLALAIAYPLPRREGHDNPSTGTGVEQVVGNGAYQLAEWRRGERLVLTRNPFYHGRFPGNVERVECPVIRDFGAMLDRYAAGDLDAVNMINAGPGAIARARAAFGHELVFTPHASTFYMAFRTDRSPFDDVRVRQAFVHAVDRDALVAEGPEGQYLPAHGGFVPPGMPGHAAGIGLAYDADRARDLLRQAGYPGGRGFPAVSWLYCGGAAGEPVVPFMQRAWRENLGLELAAESLNWREFMQRLELDRPHLSLLGWSADLPDPDGFLRVTYHSAAGIYAASCGWRSARYDALVEEAARAANPARRMGLYREADRILVGEETVIMPLCYAQGRILVKPWVTLPRVPPALLNLKDIVVEREWE